MILGFTSFIRSWRGFYRLHSHFTTNQKKQLGLDSVSTKGSNGNITGREDTSTDIEAVDAGTSDNPGRVIIKETKTTIKYDTNNTQISSITNASYSAQPQEKEPSQFTISFGTVPETTLQTLQRT